jgi:glycosyltransferase involved in cell wall biosynthesis
MKILHVSYSDLFGGAAKSAFRIHKCLKNFNVNSKVLVIKKNSNDKDVIEYSNYIEQIKFKIKNYLFILFSKFYKKNPVSFNFFNSPLLEIINKYDVDFVNLHWINSEMLSIEDIGKINKPIIITLHDMWFFTGIENYILDNNNYWKINQRIKSRNSISNFFLKKKIDKIKNFYVICPSLWMKKLARSSRLMNKSLIQVIPYPIDISFYKPIKNNLRKNSKVKILFIAFGDVSAKRKGLDLLLNSLNLIKNYKNSFELIIVGNLKNKLESNFEFKINNIVMIINENHLLKIYNNSDIVAIPSRIDNLPNVGLEAHSCGKPVVAFNAGGMNDIVDNNKTGYLVKPFCVKTFSKKLKILINDNNLRKKFSHNARIKAVKEWNETVVANKYYKYLKHIKNIESNKF